MGEQNVKSLSFTITIKRVPVPDAIYSWMTVLCVAEFTQSLQGRLWWCVRAGACTRLWANSQPTVSQMSGKYGSMCVFTFLRHMIVEWTYRCTSFSLESSENDSSCWFIDMFSHSHACKVLMQGFGLSLPNPFVLIKYSFDWEAEKSIIHRLLDQLWNCVNLFMWTAGSFHILSSKNTLKSLHHSWEKDSVRSAQDFSGDLQSGAIGDLHRALQAL